MAACFGLMEIPWTGLLWEAMGVSPLRRILAPRTGQMLLWRPAVRAVVAITPQKGIMRQAFPCRWPRACEVTAQVGQGGKGRQMGHRDLKLGKMISTIPVRSSAGRIWAEKGDKTLKNRLPLAGTSAWFDVDGGVGPLWPVATSGFVCRGRGT